MLANNATFRLIEGVLELGVNLREVTFKLGWASPRFALAIADALTACCCSGVCGHSG